MTEHTPTPWQLDGISISVGYNKPICVMGEINGFESGYASCPNWEANAAFIVKACNSHDALVKAMARAVEFFDGLDRLHDDGEAEVLDQMAAVLKAATPAQSSKGE